MARGRVGIHGSTGVFSRSGQLYTGGPSIGWLQGLHPASRLLALFVFLLTISLIGNVYALGAIISAVLVTALVSFLDITAIYKVALIPILFFALPAWLLSTWLYGRPLHDGSLFFMRSVTSLLAVLVMLHSIGLRNITQALRWFRLPGELQLVWTIMIAQVASFSELLSNMSLAREARQIQRVGSSITRQQVGRQAGLLFSRTFRRGSELAHALDARDITNGALALPSAVKWRFADYGLVLLSTVCVAAVIIW